MARQDYTWLEQIDFRGGIQESPEDAQPNQVYDARNMWIEDGLCKQRPGYTWIGVVATETAGTAAVDECLANNALTIVEGGATMSLNSAAAATCWYIGWQAADVTRDVVGYVLTTATQNTNSIIAAVDYYGSDGWTPLGCREIYGTGALELTPSTTHLDSPFPRLYCRPPADWALHIISARSRYWLRFTLVNNGSATLDASTSVTSTLTHLVNPAELGLRGLYKCNWQHSSVFVANTLTSAASYACTSKHLCMLSTIGLALNKVDSEPASFVVLPEYQIAYTAYGYQMAEINGIAGTVTVPQSESADYLVGAPGGIKAPYHPDYVAYSSMPKCKYLAYHDGRLFAANIQDNSQLLQWSAPADAFRIWPYESGLTINENDQSAINGLYAFGEHLAAFKSDSIWRIVNAGESGLTGLSVYAPVRVPGAVGTVSNSSIVNVAGILFFLAEDGVYAFDGVNKPEKISDAIDSWIKRITPGRRKFACAVNWRSKNHYLLAVSVDGSNLNNTVLAYDTKLGAWWVWDNIEAQCWMADEDDNDNEKICFGDGYGHIYQLGIGKTDHGASITSYVQTHRFGTDDESHKDFRQVRVYGSAQSVTSMDAELVVDDVPATPGVIDWTSSLEAKVGSAVVGTAKVASTRRDKKKLDYRKSGNWATVKLTNDERGIDMAIGSIKVGLDQKGIR